MELSGPFRDPLCRDGKGEEVHLGDREKKGEFTLIQRAPEKVNHLSCCYDLETVSGTSSKLNLREDFDERNDDRNKDKRESPNYAYNLAGRYDWIREHMPLEQHVYSQELITSLGCDQIDDTAYFQWNNGKLLIHFHHPCYFLQNSKHRILCFYTCVLGRGIYLLDLFSLHSVVSSTTRNSSVALLCL